MCGWCLWLLFPSTLTFLSILPSVHPLSTCIPGGWYRLSYLLSSFVQSSGLSLQVLPNWALNENNTVVKSHIGSLHRRSSNILQENKKTSGIALETRRKCTFSVVHSVRVLAGHYVFETYKYSRVRSWRKLFLWGSR